MSELLLVGGTGELGGRIAARLAAGPAPFRALVRPTSSTAALANLGAELVTGDLRDATSLSRAVRGVGTVITTANAIGRMMGGEKGLSFHDVDLQGNVHLVRAAEAAGVERFVFVSAEGFSAARMASSPLAAAKVATERLLAASPMRSVIVRPAPFQRIWLGCITGIEPDKRRAVVFGRGRAPVTYVSEDDVAEACVRVATTADPPPVLEFGGPEALTRHEVVDAYEREVGAPFRRKTVPRAVLAIGSRALRRPKPALAAIFGLALALDIEGSTAGPEPLRDLGIEPLPASTYIATEAGQYARF